MAFADWDRYSGNVSNVAVDFELFSGQNWGAPILHSALANPLSGVGESTYLRRFALDGMNASRAGVIFSSIGAGVKAGAFVGPDETRAQEARAWMRYSDLGGDPDGGVAIGGRWRHVVTSTSSVSRWGASGYYAAFGTAMPGTAFVNILKARLFAIGGNGGFGPSVKMVEVTNDPATAAPWLPTRWYRFRWRLVPTGLVQDDMTLHRLVDGGDENDEGDWLSVASLSVSPTLDPLVYQAPGAGSRYGFASAAYNNGSAISYQPYLDLVRFTETAV